MDLTVHETVVVETSEVDGEDDLPLFQHSPWLDQWNWHPLGGLNTFMLFSERAGGRRGGEG